nr:hypothetical protein [Tanacetum cinerariifolium]
TDLVISAGTDLVNPAGTDLATSAGTNLVTSAGTDLVNPVDTPMVEKSKMDEDKKGKAVDPSHYRGMIGTLLYLTASRPDL